MDLTTLKKEAPGALSEHRAEVEAELKAQATTAQQEALAAEQQRCIGLCSVLMGEESAAKLAGVLKSGVTVEQAQSMTALLGGGQQPAKQADAQGQMLSALQGAHGSGLAPMGGQDAAAQGFEALVAARMDEAKCSRAAATVHIARTNPEAHAAYLATLARKEK